jgi:predicted dehydrogenase
MVDYRTGDMVIPAINETSEALGSVVEHFAHCARTGDTPLTDGRAGLRILEVLEAANESLAANSTLVPLHHD